MTLSPLHLTCPRFFRIFHGDGSSLWRGCSLHCFSNRNSPSPPLSFTRLWSHRSCPLLPWKDPFLFRDPVRVEPHLLFEISSAGPSLRLRDTPISCSMFVFSLRLLTEQIFLFFESFPFFPRSPLFLFFPRICVSRYFCVRFQNPPSVLFHDLLSCLFCFLPLLDLSIGVFRLNTCSFFPFLMTLFYLLQQDLPFLMPPLSTRKSSPSYSAQWRIRFNILSQRIGVFL